MIKFKCTNCGKKMGVRPEYAGKKVRCPGCENALRVPNRRPARAATGVPVAAGVAPASRPPRRDSGASDISLADLAAMEQQAPAEMAEMSARLGPRSGDAHTQVPGGKPCPACSASVKPDAVLCVACGYNFNNQKRLKTQQTKESGTGAAVGAAGKVALALTLAGGVALVFAIIWVVVAAVTGYELGILAWVLGLLVGWVTAVVARTKSPGVGMAAAGIAFTGWLMAKAMLFGAILMFAGLANTVADMATQYDSATLHEAVGEQLYLEGTLDAEVTAWYQDWYEETYTQEYTEEQEQQIQSAFDQAVQEHIAGLNDEQKDAAVNAYYGIDGQSMAEANAALDELNKETDRGIWMVVGFLDILWVFLAISTAYKVGAG